MARKPSKRDTPRAAETKAALGIVETEWARSLGDALLPWFARHQRDLPWRKTADPYRVWISEIMLQQTQVVTVIPYFERFLRAFPTVDALAAADEHDVLRLWEGLGYYRRARQMLAAARVIRDQHGGQFPKSLAEIQALPGIGRYTAGAIASIAYDQPAPILEANTIRLLARLAAIAGDPTSKAVQSALWGVAEAILPRRKCGTFNQALMELGSLICTPRQPACGECPVSELCAAFQQGRQDELPTPRVRPVFESVREAAVVVRNNAHVFVRRRGAGERWAGLWDFVRFPLTSQRAPALHRELAEKVREQTGIAIVSPERIATIKHGVTRFRITLDCFVATSRGRRTRLDAEESRWVMPEELGELALSTTGRKLSRLLLERRRAFPAEFA